MTNKTLQNFADEFNIPLSKVLHFEKITKEEYGNDWNIITETIKKMCINFHKNESLNNFNKSLRILQS